MRLASALMLRADAPISGVTDKRIGTTESMRPGKKASLTTGYRLEIIISLGALLTCVAVYVVQRQLAPLRWSLISTLATTFVLCFVPAIAGLLLLVRKGIVVELRTRASEAATAERDMLRTLIDSLPDFIYMKDVEARFLLANKFCCDSMGATLDQLLGKSDFDFYPPDVAQSFFEDEQSIIRSGEPLLSRQETVVTRSGRTLSILTTKVPVKDASGRTVGVIGIGRDISRRVEAENRLRTAQEQAAAEMRERERMAIELRLAQKLESVGRLAAGLAHEINTPIQYVGDSVYFLKTAFDDLSSLLTAYREAVAGPVAIGSDALTQLQGLETSVDYEFLMAEVPKAFERTLEGTQRVAGIVRAMKEFAHPDSNEQKPADLNHALSTTLTIARSEYRYAAQIETEFGDIPEVTCSVGELNQVFLNLIVNSAHAIVDSGKDAGSGLVRIRTECLGEDVRITISDNGCGIPKDNLEKIFDPFFTTKEVGRGTGQGLAIARSIVVDKHGGRVDVDSEVGVGTRFVITLPIAGRPCKAPQ